jgi:hypothetical protein
MPGEPSVFVILLLIKSTVMARLKGIQFMGRLGDVTAYTRAGVDGIIVRKSEGINGNRVKHGSEFARTRENNAEFGGCATTSSAVRSALLEVLPLQDYNIIPQLNKIFKLVQVMDEESNRGERHVFLSKSPRMLEGFSLNRKVQLESIVRSNLTYTLSREMYSATIDIPTLVHGISLVPPQKYAMFQIVATLGIVPDMKYTKKGYIPANKLAVGYASANTPWHAVKGGIGPTTLELSIPEPPANGEALSLVLSAGIAFGEMLTDTLVQQIRHAGAAKILAVV